MIIPKGYIKKAIREIRDLVTNVDETDLSSNYALVFRGFRRLKKGMIAVRDWGTKRLFAAMITDHTLVKGEVLRDPTLGYTHDVLFTYDADTESRVYVDSTTNNAGTWKELTEGYSISALGGAPSFVSPTTTLTIPVANMTRRFGGSVPTFTSDYFKGWIIANTSKSPSQFAVITTSTATSGGNITVGILGNLTDADVAWAQANTYTIYLSVGSMYFNQSNGSTPTVNFHPIDAQKKVYLAYGSASTQRIPVEVEKSDARSYFYTGAGTSLLTRPADFWMENSQPCPFFDTIGTPAATGENTSAHIAIGGTTNGSVTVTENEDSAVSFMRITGTVSTLGYPLYRNGDYIGYLYLYINLIYNGYRLSDPICAVYASSGTGGTVSPQVALDFYINPGLMNKNITGMQIYGATFTTVEYASGVAVAPSDERFRLIKEIDLTAYDSEVTVALQTPDATTLDKTVKVTYTAKPDVGIWIKRELPQYVRKNFPNLVTSAAQEREAGTVSIVSQLGHAIDRDREYAKPRFITSTSKQQGAVMVIDIDNRTLRTSTYSGDGVHMDGIFPADSEHNIPLEAEGALLGILTHRGEVISFKQTSIEQFDLITKESIQTQADVASKNSIIKTPWGIMWAGHSYIYGMSNSGGGIQRLNTLWANKYDGTMKVTANTSYVTQAYREAIIAGFDHFYGRAWFQIQMNTAASTEYVNMIYSIPDNDGEDGTWVERILNITGSVKWFGRRSDNSLMIGSATQMLKYPNLNGDFPYRDDVLSVDTGGNGIETSIVIALGELYDPVEGSVIIGYQVDAVGSSITGAGYYEVSFFIEDGTSVFETANKHKIDEDMYLAGIGRTGKVSRWRIKLELPAASISDFKSWEIRNIWVVCKDGAS